MKTRLKYTRLSRQTQGETHGGRWEVFVGLSLGRGDVRARFFMKRSGSTNERAHFQSTWFSGKPNLHRLVSCIYTLVVVKPSHRVLRRQFTRQTNGRDSFFLLYR